MENLSEVKKLHDQVQNNIFRIMVEYKVLFHVCSTFPSKIHLYDFTPEYRFLVTEVPGEVATFINSVNRLLETSFLNIVSAPLDTAIYFIKRDEYYLLDEEEKNHFSIIHEKTFTELLRRERNLQLLG